MDGIVLTPEAIITGATLLAALGAIFGALFKLFKWYARQGKQDEDIKALKEEQSILTLGVLACLKGLSEQGCDGPVTEAINKIEAHLNERAHK